MRRLDSFGLLGVAPEWRFTPPPSLSVLAFRMRLPIHDSQVTHNAVCTCQAWAPESTIKQCAHTSGDPETNMTGPQTYSSLYNGMIHPLTKYSIRGAFWFQGEHNVVTHTSRDRYACIFGGMINDWRDAWTGIGDFPFMWAQLAPYTGYADYPGHGDVSVIRLAQADDLPKIGLDTTGMAVTIDLGDPKAPAGDVHSRLKEQVAYRLALQAMHVA